MYRRKIISLNLLKIFSILLIINSHSDILYPSKIRFLASGGSIGNELFFLISGFLFSVKPDMVKDICKRFLRLYIPAYIMILITLLCGKIHVSYMSDFIREFIWPTHFWFVGAILIYSIILYALAQRFNIEKKKSMVLFGLILFAVDVVLYILCIDDKSTWIVEDAYIYIIPFRSIYSIFAFVFGYYLKRNWTRLCSVLSRRTATILAVNLFVLFYVFKLLLNIKIVPMSLQIISQPLAILSALFIFLTFALMDLNQKLSGTRVELVINSLSNLSLESYLVQFLIISGIALCKIPFPINIIFCTAFILVVAEFLHLLDIKILKRIMPE